jgi:DNA-binding transcriptional regulator YiaG
MSANDYSNKAAIDALTRGDATKLVEQIIQTLDKSPLPFIALAKAAFTAGISMGHDQVSEAQVSEAQNFQKLLSSAPVAPEAFRTLRTALKISQTEIANLCGNASHSSVSSWEIGAEPMPPIAIQALIELAAEKLLGAKSAISGADVRALRKKLGMSQPALAEKLNVSLSTIQKWEREPNTPLSENMAQRVRPQLAELNARAAAA